MAAERTAGTEMAGRSEGLALLLGHFRGGPASVQRATGLLGDP